LSKADMEKAIAEVETNYAKRRTAK
jgi:hypothetical protein